ncbi:TonB-dependent receptor [Rhodoligotrophos defluvii]|uniref:TonB-dependent receptor n=1 Tax=Rhodoligotrophos defluvii TaxID=2561934 RepID=UPI0010C96281|nr:TonB-dependent receptor [Rhodoligotrophos defluvii]
MLRLLATTALFSFADSVETYAQTADVSVLSPSAAVNEAPMAFNIPAQPLASALSAFGRQSGLQVTLAAATTRGITSRAVVGTMTPRQALARLLQGTGISYSITSERTAVIGQAAARNDDDDDLPPIEPGTVDADGSTMLDVIDVTGHAIGEGGVAEIVITPQDLQRNNPYDLSGVFRDEPGIKVGSSIPMSQKVYVHGIEETNLNVTIDGSRQNNKIFHHNATTLIDPQLLKAVTVDAGVAPADAGPGALAGTIAYETKDARDFLTEDGVGAFAKYSFNFNGNTSIGNLTTFGMHEGWDILAYFNMGGGDEFRAGNGEKVGGTATDVINGIGKLAYTTVSGNRFAFSYEQINDDAPRPFRANIGFIDGRPPWEPRIRDYELDRKNAVFTYTDVTPTAFWDPKVVLAYSGTDVHVPVFLRPVPPATEPSSYDVSGTTESLNGKAENKWTVPLGTVVTGIDFYDDKAKLNDKFGPATEYATNVGGYAQARLDAWDRARLSFGGRVDQQWFTGTDGSDWSNAGFSGNISGEYELVKDYLTAKAGYSHVWAGIPLAENFIMNPNWDYHTGPETVTADNYTIGLLARYNGFTLEGNVFRTDIYNARVAKYAIGGPGAFGAIIARDVESEGFEIGAGYNWGPGFVRVKYADIDVTIDGKPADSDVGIYLATPVGQVVTLTAAHHFVDWGVTIGGDAEFVFDYDDVAPGNRPYKGYEVFSLFAEYRPTAYSNLSFRIDARNLLDETYSDRATYGQEFGTVTPLYEPGRSIILSATARF